MLWATGFVDDINIGGVFTQEWKQGNVFDTREEAELESKKRAVLHKLKILAKGYKFTVGCNNFYIATHGLTGGLAVYSRLHEQCVGNVYFPTFRCAENAINVLGAELEALFK